MLPEDTTNITDEVRHQFNALASGDYDNFALFSCFFDGEPTSVIVAIDFVDDAYQIYPLFVALTDKMIDKLADHEGTVPGHG